MSEAASGISPKECPSQNKEKPRHAPVTSEILHQY